MLSNTKYRFMPLIIAISVIVGIFIGTFVANLFYGNRLNIINASSTKINDLLHIIDEQYVDSVNISDLLDKTIPTMLSELDPHSSYISSKDARTADEELKGSFSGIGVQFTINHDTVYVNNVIKGGPSEKVGILAGDRIIAVDGQPYVGKIVTNEETMHRLKGVKGSKVKLQIMRRGEKKNFTVVRGDIPIHSIDATYMLTPSLGYVKIKSFGETTYPELLMSLAKLQEENFDGLVVDLRGNGGGYLGSAIQIVNEFLPDEQLIVYTQGLHSKRSDYYSDGSGAYKTLPLIVLTDEITASAAEIFSGAIQDNDRGIIVGRRTFGKGLVQQPIEFSDGSCIHLTIARYYTPSGRCIQKPYDNYDLDILTRYNHGEFFNEDSIRQSGEKYKTKMGRIVYGGGGIMPDYFVAQDTSHITPYFSAVVEKGLISEYCFNYTDANRSTLERFDTAEKLVRYLRSQRLVEQFVRYADQNGITRRNNQILKSQQLFEEAIYGTIVYNLFDMEEYTRFINRNDLTVKRAVDLYNNNQTQPTNDK